MSEFEFPTPEGAIEVAKYLGIEAEEILSLGQDWEYIYPKLEDLPRYIYIYKYDGISNLAKRVLGCFIFEVLEYHLREGRSDTNVREILNMLYSDIEIHREEFRDWSLRDDPYYDNHLDDAWTITPYVREFV